MRTMNSDGSNNRQLGFGLFGNPSTALHGGRRWFLYHKPIPDSYYPDGTQVFELFALRDDYDVQLNNNSTTKVQLTNDIDLQAKPWRTAWLPGDQQISFKARRWSGGGVVEGGIYTASPVFDANGNITGLAAQPITPAIPFPLVETAPGDFWPAFEDYSWGPHGRPGGLLRRRESRPVDSRPAGQPASEDLHRLLDVAAVLSGRDKDCLHITHKRRALYSDDQVEWDTIQGDRLGDIKLDGLPPILVTQE